MSQSQTLIRLCHLPPLYSSLPRNNNRQFLTSSNSQPGFSANLVRLGTYYSAKHPELKNIPMFYPQDDILHIISPSSCSYNRGSLMNYDNMSIYFMIWTILTFNHTLGGISPQRLICDFKVSFTLDLNFHNNGISFEMNGLPALIPTLISNLISNLTSSTDLDLSWRCSSSSLGQESMLSLKLRPF